MAEYTGKLMKAYWGTGAISQITRVAVETKAAEPDFLDATHAEDTSRVEVEGMAGAVRTRITLEAYDTSDGAHELLDISVNSTGTFVLYPEGTGTGNETVTVSSARFLGSPREFPFGDLVKISAEWFATGEASYGTVAA
jgi:hypothetical protein